MATHSNILAWEIPWTEEPGRLQSMGSQRVGHDLATKYFPYGSAGKESTCNVGDLGLIPGLGRSPGEGKGSLFFCTPKSLQMVTAAMKLKDASPWKKATTNLDSMLESRDITLSTKVCLVKAMIFPIVMYGRGSWTIKKAER